jgi:DNA-binding MarR family transcriptional regulator
MESDKIVEIKKFRENKNRLLGRLLKRSFRFMSEVASEFLKGKEYTDFRVGHIMALVHIDIEGVTVNTLALRAGITKQGMSKVIKELTDGGYVYVEKHPTDARSVMVKLTENGYDALLEWKRCAEHIDNQFAEVLGKERLEQLKDILGDLVDYYETNVEPCIELGCGDTLNMGSMLVLK